jgi:predicted DNA-binding WGR domain protein
MTDENKPENDLAQPTNATEFEFRYAGQSQMVADGDLPQLALFGNLQREPVFLDAVVKDPLRFREALAAVYSVVGSDYRYVPKDRTAYHAYRRMRSQTANLGAWQAQQAYFDWLARNDPFAFMILDPVITVHPDQLFLEVFSKDEGAYANLSVSMEAFELDTDPVFGTTNIDFSPELFRAVEQFRSYRKTRLTIGQQAVKVKTEDAESVLEKKIQVPDSWLRGFLQVQSSAMLPRSSFKMQPMELYNVLRQLRLNKDQKGKRRSLRVELVPGEFPRIVMEPWETVIECQSAVYGGTQSKVVRVWGRRRLMLLRRMLPLVDEVEVHLTGSGLPSFWVLRAGSMTFTLGLTGFTASNWSQAVNFDLMLPRANVGAADKPLAAIMKRLAKDWSGTPESLGSASKQAGEELVASLQGGCQRGQLMFDVANDVYRLRPLTDQPLDLERLEFRNVQERQAHDLVLRQAAVTIVKENHIFGSGLELTGKAQVKEDRREYAPQLLISDEGFVRRAECTCKQFRHQDMKAGPCAHLIALRIAHAIREKVRRETGEGDDAIRVETRTFSQRDDDSETVYQVTLDERRLKVRWGRSGEAMRVQQFRFSSVDEARDDYLQRVDELLQKGFLDAS